MTSLPKTEIDLFMEALEKGGLKIRPLEWEASHHEDYEHHADDYRVYSDYSSHQAVWLDGNDGENPWRPIGDYTSLEEAQIACYQHRVKLIFSLLTLKGGE